MSKNFSYLVKIQTTRFERFANKEDDTRKSAALNVFTTE